MAIRTGDPALVREINLSILLNALRERAPVSRAQLAKITGLSKATVSSLVEELLRVRFVRELPLKKHDEIGRPAIALELNPKVGSIIGAEIGVDFISVVLTNFAGEIIWRHQEETAGSGRDQILQRTVHTIRQAYARSEKDFRRVLGLGLGVPGLVDVQSGTVLFAPNLGWQDVPLRSLLRREFAFPVYVDNEANMGALGESFFGAARGCSSVLYLSAGVGLGGGIVIDGRLLPGALGLAGEVGHMTLVLDGPACNCGNHGCWEALASQGALLRRAREALAAGQPSCLQSWTDGDPDNLSMALLVDAARAWDAVALAALKDTGEYLGAGLANLINALNPERVVFGGTLSVAGEFLLPAIERTVASRALRWSQQGVKIVPASYGSDACVMGGIATVYQHVLSQPKAARAGYAEETRSPLPARRLALGET